MFRYSAYHHYPTLQLLLLFYRALGLLAIYVCWNTMSPERRLFTIPMAQHMQLQEETTNLCNDHK